MGGLVAIAVGTLVLYGLVIGVLAGDPGGIVGGLGVARMQAEIETQARMYQTLLAGCARRIGTSAGSVDGHPRGWPAPAGGVAGAFGLTCQDGRSVFVSGEPPPPAPSGFAGWAYHRDPAAICLTLDPVVRSEDTDAAIRASVQHLGSNQSRLTSTGGLLLILTQRVATLPAGSACSST